MSVLIRRASGVILLLTLIAGCGSGITSPSPAPATATSAYVPLVPVARSELAGSARTFGFDHEGRYPVSSYTRASRFVLYDNGAFVLEYPSLGDRGYRGKYRVANGAIDFQWDDWNTGGAWESTAAFDGATLTIQYGFIMNMDGFEDAGYVLRQ